MSNQQWDNRITHYGTQSADQFLMNPDNPRRHPEKQRKAVKGSLDTLGWVAPVIVNKRTGYLVDGHERLWQALQQGDDTQVPYIEIDISAEEERQFLATFDYITYMAEYDRDVLGQLMQGIDSDNQAVKALLDEMKDNYILSEETDNNYSRKIESPVYEPSDTKPTVSSLYNSQKAFSLIEAINASNDLTEDERLFLTLASYRHVVFNFSAIADFYAHSSAPVQRLMEDNALIVIDFDRAIELGYVKLTKQIQELIKEEKNG